MLCGFALLYWKASSARSHEKILTEWMHALQQSQYTASSSVQQILQEHSRQLNDRLEKAAEVIRDVNKEMGKMSEIGRRMEELQVFLKNPKSRGSIGEHVLNDLIAQSFPKQSFHLQYAFRSGNIVDAIIKTDGGILPIDAKFPLEQYTRLTKAESQSEKAEIFKEFTKDVRRHIDAIAKKYILPDEGTLDFALMYVPSESVFYEIIGDDGVLEYARSHRVFIVSPSTFYAHLQTIMLSFEGRRIEHRAKEMLQLIRGLQVEYQKVDDAMGTLGKHLSNAQSQYAQASFGMQNIGIKLDNTLRLTQEAGDQKIENITGN
jgi:DNA recombination protein RmuC